MTSQAPCGSRYLFTVVDSYSRWLEALPMRDIAAATCADTLIAGWISRYGVPAQLTSDLGPQFTLAIWDALCEQLGIQHQPTTAFHPQANGMVERCHRRLKDALRARLAGSDCMATTPSLGPDGVESCPNRGHRRVRRRNRVRRATDATGADFGRSRAGGG
jgi:transposase InsO family protein